MRITNRRLVFVIALIAWSGAHVAHAAIVVPGANGSDGVLNITGNTVIDLSQAVTGAWDLDNSADAGKGVYDPTKWAVVFKYSSVTIAAGVTLSFKNHPSYAPVVWLVSGNVTINGTVDLNGSVGLAPPGTAEPGPGGFRGGMGILGGGVGSSAGFGVGGGATIFNQGFGASFGSVGVNGPLTYGNPSNVPLIGGSGGGGDGDNSSGGGGGGGAILVASTSTISIGGSGVVRANGGQRHSTGLHAGGGSGGAIRFVADRLAGAGQMRALGGEGHNDGGVGRIRLERVTNEGTTSISPDPSVIPLAPDATALIWPPSNAPTVRIVSIGGVAAPEDPRPLFGATVADVAVPATANTQVIVETIHVEQASQVRVRATPRSSGSFVDVAAALQSIVSTDPLTVRWSADLPVQIGYSAVQVKVIRP